jgi:ectoine hydroxylase-related dioxygenase (phytanoyl-CoA dioxygenase family)
MTHAKPIGVRAPGVRAVRILVALVDPPVASSLPGSVPCTVVAGDHGGASTVSRNAPITGTAGDSTRSLQLSEQQIASFDTFGFLVLPGLFAAEIDRIDAGFEEVFARERATTLDPENEFHNSRDPRYERETRWIIPVFIDKSENLSWLRDDSRVDAIARALLAERYVYAESDGNTFNCDVYWHLDAYGAAAAQRHIKLFFYLDPLRHDTGALRVIPGSHHDGPYTKTLRRRLVADPKKVPDVFGVGVDEIPSHTLETNPGDLVVLNFRTLHGSFNGPVRRRLFTVNFAAPAVADA